MPQFGRSDHPGDSAAIEHSEIDALEIFDAIRHINDPEHPYSLEQLKVLEPNHIRLDNAKQVVYVRLTPTIPHCSMATLIGLCVNVKLLRTLPSTYKIQVKLTPGSHQSEAAVNKQLADKERVAAALENVHLLEVVNRCIADSDKLSASPATEAQVEQVRTVLHLLDQQLHS